MSETILKSASVKVMLSYDYSHFESSMSLENEAGLSMKEINEARKNCQRLCDNAVRQYKKAKEMAALRTNGDFKIRCFEDEVTRIRAKDEQDRTVKEIAIVKQFEDENWRSQFDYDYDYEDDGEEYRN